MDYRLILDTATTYTGDILELCDFVGSLSPDNEPIIQALADSATAFTEKYIGQPLGKRQLRVVCTRGETELMDTYYRQFLSGGSFTYLNSQQWLELPCSAESIQNIYLTSWGSQDLSPLVSGTDYDYDLWSRRPRIRLSYNLFISDLFNSYSNLIIDFTGGLYESDGSIPSPVNNAIKFLTKRMFEERGEIPSNLIDNGYVTLLSNYRIPAIVGGRV
ncbi:head-tail connector protein [Gluconobacter frateurii]|uniref:Phage protein n=1 Tax=Gluconobacter frateurii NRIC 0228 TaxID=1307946 RepID=A0ABQ0QFP9_9PROT|nr:hypothetical protein [Gluconobacter frateurii]GBR17477.1 hypothetical protein AA0228_3037 [Gluconobacter frateurii NRIC 0228]GLP89615.1 hypothetical protein GCM10007868_06900 [Gluconobacter frateurii]